MELLIGMMLLLQIVISIQIMLVGKQMLQRISGLEAEMIGACGVKEETDWTDEKCVLHEEPVKKEQNLSGDKAEALINEVLSEVFS